MKFDSQGFAAMKVALSRRLVVKFFGASRPFRYLESEFTSSDVPVRGVEKIHQVQTKENWFPEVDQYISAPKYFRNRAVYKIQDASVDTATGYIYDSDDRLLGDFISWSVPTAIADRPAVPSKFKQIKEEGEALYLGTQGFYHWLIEDFPAYLIAKNNAPDAVTYVKKRSPSYVIDALNLLEAKHAELPVAAKIPTLVVASKCVALVPSRVDVDVLKEFGNSVGASNQGPQKLYISRRDSGRMPENELEIENMLAAGGFKIVQLSNHTLLEQISLFKNAKLIVGTHGAGLANLAWCDSSITKVIEIKLDSHPKCFEWLAKVSGMDYFKIETMSSMNWEVDLAALHRAIELLEE